MKLLFAILLCLLPVLWDLIIGRVFWKKRKTVAHMLTTSVRLLIMVILSYFNPSAGFFPSMLLSIAFHFLAFPILYNRLILNEHWAYIGKTAWLDLFEQKVRNNLTTEFTYWFKVSLLGTGIVYYVHGCLKCW